MTPRPTYEAYSPARQEGSPPGRPEDRISDLIGVLLQNLEQTAADRPHPLSARQARNGCARHFRHTSRTVHPPAAGG